MSTCHFFLLFVAKTTAWAVTVHTNIYNGYRNTIREQKTSGGKIPQK